MKNVVELLEPPVLPGGAAMTPDESEYVLKVAGVYQDVVTRDWAMQACRRATELAGEERIQNMWYNANSLRDPGTLLEAVRAALVADVIVVSVYAAEELPLELYGWFEAWLPRRTLRVGALAAVIGVAEPLASASVRTLDYLQGVARQAQLDFIPQKRRWPVAAPVSSIKVIAERAGTAAPAPPELTGQSYAVYYHCGLNE